MFDTMSMVKVQTNKDIAEALSDALVELVKEKRVSKLNLHFKW